MGGQDPAAELRLEFFVELSLAPLRPSVYCSVRSRREDQRLTRIAHVIVLVVVLAYALPMRPAAASPAPIDGNCPLTAAREWGEPNRVDDFTDGASLAGWDLYDGPGHVGNGMRLPQAITIDGGLLTITGDPEGNSGGMAWLPGQLYGRWEVCIKSFMASPNYHSVALLWPDSENWPADGEIDFMEILDPQRQTVTASLNHRDPKFPVPDDPNFRASTQIDATQWHSWAVEWSPTRVAGFVDGAQWFEVTDHIPQSPMHLCIQLDNFGGDLSQGGQQLVDWVRQYPLT
jgi:hypothetical protein